MEIRFNPRENGACPMCRRPTSCRVRAALTTAVQPLRSALGQELQVVIYSCPLFVEKS